LNLSEGRFLHTISHSSAYLFTTTLSPYFDAVQTAILKPFDYKHVAGFNHFLREIEPFVSVVTSPTLILVERSDFLR